MAYTRVNWQDLPSTSTPVNATNLNNMDSAIKINDDKLLGNTAMGDILPTSVTTTGNVTVGGTLYTSSSGREDYAEYGFTYDGAGNMQHKRNNSSDSFQIKANNGAPCLQILPETGAVNVGGDVGLGGNLAIIGHLVNKTMSSTNLNDIYENGTYSYDNGSNTYSNAPTTDGIHILNVLNNGTVEWIVQEDYVLRWGASSIDKYIRQHSPAGWSNWQKII